MAWLAEGLPPLTSLGTECTISKADAQFLGDSQPLHLALSILQLAVLGHPEQGIGARHQEGDFIQQWALLHKYQTHADRSAPVDILWNSDFHRHRVLNLSLFFLLHNRLGLRIFPKTYKNWGFF